jgi:2-keto-4-pentenoate hydratase
LRIASDIPDADWLHAHPEEAISSAFAVIELHNYMFRIIPHNAQELIGNNAIHAGVVVPPSEPPLTDPLALLDAQIRGSRNGAIVGIAVGGALLEGPLGSLVRLAQHLEGFGRSLQGGQIVLTGSPLPLYRVADGEEIEVSSDRSETVVIIISRHT